VKKLIIFAFYLSKLFIK